MIRAHAAAVRTALSAVPNLTVYEGKVPADAPGGYVVVYPDQGAASSTRLDHLSDQRNFRVQTTSVGISPDQSWLIAEKVQAALLDVTLTVAGRACWPVRLDTSRSIERDDDVQPPKFYAVDIWALQSVPA